MHRAYQCLLNNVNLATTMDQALNHQDDQEILDSLELGKLQLEGFKLPAKFPREQLNLVNIQALGAVGTSELAQCINEVLQLYLLANFSQARRLCYSCSGSSLDMITCVQHHLHYLTTKTGICVCRHVFLAILCKLNDQSSFSAE